MRPRARLLHAGVPSGRLPPVGPAANARHDPRLRACAVCGRPGRWLVPMRGPAAPPGAEAMITSAQCAEIQRLYCGEHWKIGTIAAQLGLHPETVRGVVVRQPEPSAEACAGPPPSTLPARHPRHPGQVVGGDRLQATTLDVLERLVGATYTPTPAVRTVRRQPGCLPMRSWSPPERSARRGLRSSADGCGAMSYDACIRTRAYPS